MKNILFFIFFTLCVISIFWYAFRETKKEIPIEPTYKIAENETAVPIPDGKDWGEDPKMK
jgi:cbb3-type cytochrome oxidase subunit 3